MCGVADAKFESVEVIVRVSIPALFDSVKPVGSAPPSKVIV